MTTVQQLYTDRVNEIDLYFGHLTSLKDSPEEELFKVLKANLFLMLYNIVEATVSNTIEEIRDQIFRNPDIDFDCLKLKIKETIIRDLKNISPENFVSRNSEIKKDIIKLSFNKKKISDGNIDNNTLIELSAIYGFEIENSDYSKTQHGVHLSTIKNKRNDLAHGTFSFAEVGKDYTIEDLEKYKECTVNYLSYILQNVESYLLQQEYKAS